MAKSKASKRKERQEKLQAEKRQQRMLWIVIGLTVAGAVIFFVAQSIRGSLTRQDIGEFVPTQGRDHIALGDAHIPYNSDPPTSGPHADPVENGFYDTPIPDENIIHNLEHGFVVISYDCNQLEDCETVKANIRNVLDQYESFQLVAVARENRDAPIALTAWQRIDLLDNYDEERITAFIEAWRGRAPENVP